MSAMKNIALFCFALSCLAFSSCANTYRTQSSGQDNVSYITVLKEKHVYLDDNSVVVVVDDAEYPYGKVQKVNRKIKAQPVRVEPGKHRVRIFINGEPYSDETVFLGVQQSKIITIR